MTLQPPDQPRERLLDAAGQVFAEKGYHAATVREIVQRADANIAAVNYYFGDKEHLYVEAVRQAGLCCAQRAPMPQWAPATPPASKLRDFIHTFLSRTATGDDLDWRGVLILRELVQPSAACMAFVDQFVRPNCEILTGILRELLPADVPETRRRLIAFSIIGQCLHYRVARGVIRLLVGDEFDTYDVERLTEHITDFSLAGMGLRPDGGPKGEQP
jgi:AcrR family transcriptional regulator